MSGRLRPIYPTGLGDWVSPKASFVLGAAVGALAAIVLFCAPVLIAVALGAPLPQRAVMAVLR